MKVLLVLAGLVATTFAWAPMQNGMGNGMWNGMGNGMGNGPNVLQQLLSGMGGNMGGGNMGGGNMGGGNGWGNMGGGLGYPSMGGNGNHGLMGMMLMNMLFNMKHEQAHAGYDRESKSHDSSDSSHDSDSSDKGDPHYAMEKFEKFMKGQLAGEFADAIMMHMEMKKAKEEFEMAIKSICHVAYAVKYGMEKNNESRDGLVSKEDEEAWMEGAETRTDEEAVAELMGIRDETPAVFGEIALRVGLWVCKSGHELENVLKKMEKGNECEAKDGKSYEDRG